MGEFYPEMMYVNVYPEYMGQERGVEWTADRPMMQGKGKYQRQEGYEHDVSLVSIGRWSNSSFNHETKIDRRSVDIVMHLMLNHPAAYGREVVYMTKKDLVSMRDAINDFLERDTKRLKEGEGID
jgi:hypothetical protein